MTITEYVTAVCANIKAGKMDRAKRAFDLAWKLYAAGKATDEEEKYLFWLRNNFYPRRQPSAMTITSFGSYYEDKILAQGEEDTF